MDRVAIFVDAGYLFAQVSTALTGSKKPRASLTLYPSRAVDEFKAAAALSAPDCKLLRIYWYDGAIGGARPTTDQALLANLNDVKLRLGFVNSSGQQKGVDSLIVTDLIELARLKSISDAVLMSGDEDVRVGVQIAQNYGVRIHLLGIEPSRGSQSTQLLQEADTTTEWNREKISSFLAERSTDITAAPVQPERTQPEASKSARTEAAAGGKTDASKKIEIAVSLFVEALEGNDLQGIAAYWGTERGVPADFDRKLLPTCRDAIGRDLDRGEIKQMRAAFQRLVTARLSGQLSLDPSSP